MGNRSRTSIVLLSFWATIGVVTAQIPVGTQHFTIPGLGSSNESCAEADCQQGTCVPNDNAMLSILFPYTCECNPGWATLQQFVPVLEVPSLPCNVPNCSLNLNCPGDLVAAPPTPSSPIGSASANLCLVPGICGHGTCEAVSGSITASINCVCDPGYSNAANMTGAYCVSDCELLGGCSSLNITLLGSSPPAPPSAPASDQNATNAGSRGCIPFNSDLYIAATVAVVWSFFRQ